MSEDRHIYSTRFSGKVNVWGYIVGGVPFKNLYDAETYCVKLGLDPDRTISLNQQKAKDIANALLPELDFLLLNLDAMHKQVDEKMKFYFNERNKAKEGHGISAEVHAHLYQEYGTRELGKSSGFYEACKRMRERRWELWSMSRYKVTEPVIERRI